MIQSTITGDASAVKDAIATGASTVVGDLEKFIVQEFAKFLGAIMGKFGQNSISTSTIAGNADHGGAQLSSSINIAAYPAGSNDTPTTQAPIVTK